MIENISINEKTRQGKNLCSVCGKPKTMYYAPWCSFCDKPKIYNVPELNFIQCLEHLEAIGNEGIKDRLWEHYYSLDEIRNDTSFELCFPEEDEGGKIAPQIWKDLYLIKSMWNITEKSIRVFVSW
jgi:hypothetical protein